MRTLHCSSKHLDLGGLLLTSYHPTYLFHPASLTLMTPNKVDCFRHLWENVSGTFSLNQHCASDVTWQRDSILTLFCIKQWSFADGSLCKSKRKWLDVCRQVVTCDDSFCEDVESIKNILLGIFCLFSLSNVYQVWGNWACVYVCFHVGRKCKVINIFICRNWLKLYSLAQK